MRKFSPVSEMRKGQRSWGRVLAPNLGNKANMDKHKIFYFRASVTLKAVSLQLNGMLMMCKIQQTMQDDAIRTTRIHPAIRPGNRASPVNRAHMKRPLVISSPSGSRYTLIQTQSSAGSVRSHNGQNIHDAYDGSKNEIRFHSP